MRKPSQRWAPRARRIHSTLTIRYPTPMCVWMYWGESGVGSSFLRRVAMKTRRDAMLLSQLCPQIFWVINVCVKTFPTFQERRHNSLNSMGVRCSSCPSR